MPKSLGIFILSWKFFALVILIIGVIGAVLLVQQRNNFLNFAGSPKVILNLVPNSIYLNKDESATVQVIINTQTTGVGTADIHLRFDPNIITVDQIKPGRFFPNLIKSEITQDEAVISLSSDLPRNGLGILAELRIRSLVKAPSEIIFSKSTKVTPFNQTENALYQTYGTKIYDEASKVPKTAIGNTTIPEGVVYSDPDSFIRQLTEPRIEDAALKQQEIKPGFSSEYAKYLLSLPLQQINKLNKNLEKKVGEFIK